MSNRDPDNTHNVLLALALSMVVLFTWQYFYAGPKMEAEKERLARQQEIQSGTPGKPAVPQAPIPSTTAEAPAGSPPAVPTTTVLAQSRAAALSASPRILIDTPSLQGSIPLKGARLDDLVLKNYRETVERTSPNVVLLSPAGTALPYFAEHGWVADSPSTKVPDRDTLWTLQGNNTLTPEAPVQLTWNNGSGLTFNRTITVDRDYLFSISDKVENASGAEVRLYPYARVYRLGTPLIQGFYILHEGLIGVAGAEGLQEITYGDALKPEKQKSFKDVTGGWLGITDKYWATALIPDQNTSYRANYTGQAKGAGGYNDSYQTDYLLEGVIVPNGQSHTIDQRVYAGAKQVGLIEGYQDKLGIKQFDLMIDWGWFYFITKPLFRLIDTLYKLLGNFGLAILATTVLVKALFYPLANKSYVSMAKMKKLQPQIEQLRDRFKDDKARQQQELMKLYQEEKINPLAGCLPILLQIPVFFALYKVLFVTIDMRHAPFYGWIKDLSAPDPTSLFNLFGLLPFAVPEALHVGVWPVVMGLTMWIQMQLNPKQPDPTQQMVFNWMPVLFTFLLATFPAGLVIYWAWSNILSIAQQWMIMKRQGAEIPLKNNLKSAFGWLGRLFGGGKA